MRAGLCPLSASQYVEDVAFNVRGAPCFGDVDLLAAGDDALVRIKPDEGVASHLFATLDRLQQKAFALLPCGAQKCRYRSFEVGRERAVNRNKRVLFGERQKFLAAGLDETRGRLHSNQCNCRKPSRY